MLLEQIAMVVPPTPFALDELRVQSDRRLVYAALLTLLIPAAFFAGIDLLGIRPGTTSIESRLLARALSLVVPVTGLWLIRGARTVQMLSDRVLAIALVAVPVILTLQLQQPRQSPLILSTLLLILVAMYTSLPNTPARQIGPPLVLSTLVAVAQIWWFTQAAGAVVDDLVMIASVNVIGIMAVWRRHSLQEQVSESWRQQVAAHEREREAEHRADRAVQDLRRLRGIIPICASCKQVRTDAGEWQQIERYVHEHSDADFSHGVCPSCARKLYAEFLEEPPSGGVTT